MARRREIMLLVKAMQHRFLVINICLLLITAGCIQQDDTKDDTNEKFADLPLGLTFSADTLDRPEDNGSTFDLKTELSDKPVLILWIAAGCSGCHDWTEMIRESLENQTLNSSTLNVVSVHRWAGIESSDRIMQAFGVDTNKSTYTPWTIVIPEENATVSEFTSGMDTGFSLYEGYNNPLTPTLQLIGQDGVKMWQSKTYWANESVLEEAWEVAEKIRQ